MQTNYNLIIEILNRIGAGDPDAFLVDNEEVKEWSQPAFKVFQKLGVIKPASPAKVVDCPGCEEACLMPVHVYPAQDGRPARIFIACDKREDTGRILIELAALEQWQINITRFAFLLATSLGTGHVPDEIVPQQAFYLGSLSINRKRQSAFFIANTEILNSALESDLFRQFAHPFFLIAAGLHGHQEMNQGQAILSLHQLLLLSDDNSLSFDWKTLENLISEEDSQQAAAAIVAGKNVTEENVFRKEGQKWILRFKGSTDIFCNDNKGFLYISYLLGSPDREIHSQLLIASADGSNLENVVGAGGVVNPSEIRENQQGGRSENPILDKQARKEYQERINELRKLIDAAEKDRDFVRKDNYQHEYELLRKEIVAASGLGGQARNMADDAEKARKSVSEAVRRSMKIIKKEHPDLFLHLKNTISLGEYCSYTPEEEIDWKLNRGQPWRTNRGRSQI